MASLKCKRHFVCYRKWWENCCLLQKKKYFPAGHSCRDGNMEKHWISECVCLRTVRTKLMPHWSAILDMAGNLLLVIMRIAKSAEVSVFVPAFRCTCCTCGCLWVCVSMWSSMCKCDSFTHLQRSIRFQTITLAWQGFSSLLCCSLCVCHCFSLVCQIQQRISQSSLIMMWHAKTVGWWWRRNEIKQAGRGRWGVFCLQHASFSPRSLGHNTPAGT